MRSGNNVSTLTNNEPRPPSDNEPVVTLAEADDVGEKIVQTSKCKGATTIPIFLKSEFVCYVQYHTIPYLPYPTCLQMMTTTNTNKLVIIYDATIPTQHLTHYHSTIHTETYKMIDTCDPNIASW